MGRIATAVERMCYLSSSPGFDDGNDAFRMPLRVSRQTIFTCLHDLGYEHKEAKKGFAPRKSGKHASGLVSERSPESG